MNARPATRPLYYGWIMLLALSVTETTSWGILYYSFSVFLRPMEAELGWSRAQLTGAFSLALMVSALAALPVGRWLDRHGPRGLMTAGSCAAALLLVAWAQVGRLPAFYAIWAGLGATLAALLYEPAFAVVATWFVRHRHRALTILTLFGGLASIIFMPLTQWLVGLHGWRPALLVLAAIHAGLTIPLHALVLRRRPSDLGLEPDGLPRPARDSGAAEEPSVPFAIAVRSTAFKALVAAFVLSALATAAVTVHLIPYLVERGFGTAFAATAAGLVGAMQLPGRLLFAPMGTRVRRQWVTVSIFLLQASALGALPLLGGRAGVLGFAAAFGIGNGMITLARAARIVEFFGPTHYGSLSGVLAFCHATARAIGPVGAGVMYGWAGGYDHVLWTLAGAALLAAGAGFAAERLMSRDRASRQ